MAAWLGGRHSFKPRAHLPVVTSLQAAFFFRYDIGADETARAMTDRAQECVTIILEECFDQLTSGTAAFQNATSSAALKERGKSSIVASEIIIEQAINMFYFGSGAFQNSNKPIKGLPNSITMTRFIRDYDAVLKLISRSGNGATIHKLIALYGYIAPGDPSEVFDGLHSILIGTGMRSGYQFEILASSAVVGIVKEYIADFRWVFEDEGRRGRLIAILRLFSDAGWPEPLKLMYDLPDLIR